MIADGEPKKYKNTIIFPASLDGDAVKIIHRLKRFGYEAYLVGGCVRDLLLGYIPKDFDIATSARPRQIRRIFRNSKIIGRRFKLVHVIFSDKIIEVSTFRKPPSAPNNLYKTEGLLIVRDNVYGTQMDDSLRRDFTLNSLYYDIDEEEVIDYAGGVRDIQRRLLCTNGDPQIRFQEDPVRILRAVRFSCRLNLELEPSVFTAMRGYAKEISKSAPQRVSEEIIRLMACGASQKALTLMLNLGLFEILLPELYASLNERSLYFGRAIGGRDLLLRMAGAMDRADRGRRRFANPLFLAVLFSPMCGSVMDQALEKGNGPRDPGVVLSTFIRPIAMRMGISRWELSNIKQIVIAFMRLNAPRKRRKFKIGDFVRRAYFPDALEFYRQIIEAQDLNMDRYRWWSDRHESAFSKSKKHQGKAPLIHHRKRRKYPPKRSSSNSKGHGRNRKEA